MDSSVNIKITRAEKLSEIFSLMLLPIAYIAYTFGIFHYLTDFIPSYTPKEISMPIIIGIFPSLYVLMATRSPSKALWPIIIVLIALFGQYIALRYKLF